MFEWVTNFITDNWDNIVEFFGFIIASLIAFLSVVATIITIIVFFFPSFGKKVRRRLFIMFKWMKYIIPSNAGGFSSFSHRYNKHVIFEHRIFNVRGLRIQGTFVPEFEKVFFDKVFFEKVFVELRVACPNDSEELPGNYLIWDFLQHLNQKHHKGENTRVFVIIGAPGCGKTALLQHIALTFARKQQDRHGLSAYVPLLLFLREPKVQAIVTQKLTLADLARTHFSNLNPPSSWFAKQLKKGKCIILLDGLDEVVNFEQRQKLSTWINDQITEYRYCHFIITSRPQGYHTDQIAQAKVLKVQDFDTEQVQHFVRAWYLENEVHSNEVHSFGSEDEGVRNKAKQEADDLLQCLQANSALNELTVNPLLLTMIVMVHRAQKELLNWHVNWCVNWRVNWRVELYDGIHDVLLGHWRRARSIQDDTLTTVQKRVVLQPLAAQMMERKLCDIHIDEAVKIIKDPLQNVGSTASALEFLRGIQTSSGLLLEDEVNRWSFAHLTFQKYLAAIHFSEKKIQLQLNWNEIVNDRWWHETLCFYAVKSNATELVQACLDHDTVQTLTLAVNLLEVARELDRKVREQIEDRLMSDELELDDYQRRQLAPKVLNRRFKLLHRIDVQREIDLNYITCAEYQLFLDEKRTQNEYYQPDHWTGYTFPQGTAQAPIRGIRAEDAKAFCEWLTHRQANEITYYHYRLPQHAEIIDYSPQTIAENLSTWYQENDSYRFDWLKSTKELYTNFLSAEIPFEHIHPIDSADVIDLARTCYRVYTRNSNRVLDNVLGLIYGYAFVRVFALDRAPNLARDLDRALDRNLDRDNPNLDRERARGIALALVRDFNCDPIVKMITENNFPRAKQLAQNMQIESNPTSQQVGTLLHELLVCATATTHLEVRQAWRKYMGTITKYILIASNEGEKNQHRSWWQQLLHRKTDHSKDKLALLNLYWWLQIVTAREEGKLPACEGIRIVREQNAQEVQE